MPSAALSFAKLLPGDSAWMRVPSRIGLGCCDGLTAPKPGMINFEIIRRHVTDVLTVSDEAILAAMGLIIRHLKVIVEPAGAAALAGILADGRFRGRRVGVLLSGSNTGVERMREALAATG